MLAQEGNLLREEEPRQVVEKAWVAIADCLLIIFEGLVLNQSLLLSVLSCNDITQCSEAPLHYIFDEELLDEVGALFLPFLASHLQQLLDDASQEELELLPMDSVLLLCLVV